MRLQRIFFFPLKYNNFSTFSQLHNLQPPIHLPYLPSAAFQSPSTVLPASLFIISSLSIDIIPLNSTVSYTFPPYFPEPPTRFYSLQKVSSSRYDRSVKEDAICQCMTTTHHHHRNFYATSRHTRWLRFAYVNVHFA